MNNIPQWSCEKFAQETFSAAPFPGGGGVSAFIAALGTALGGMVCNLTAGKPAYAEYEEEILKIRTQAESLKDNLMTQIDADAENFYPLSLCYKMPEETEEQKLEKHDAMQKALLVAIKAPVEIIKLSCEAMELQKELLYKGSSLAVSDVGCGVMCLKSGILSAWLNVKINLKFMDDKASADEICRELEPMIEASCALADKIYEAVLERLE